MGNIAFIPVRGGSKSIPMKNIKLLSGKPLVYWTARAANNAECIDKVIIATDSKEIKTIVQSFGLKKAEVYDRKPENAQDSSSTESAMIEYIESANLSEDDYFFLIQATSPLLTSKNIDDMFNKFLEDGADSAFTGVISKRFYWEQNPDGSVKPFNYDYKNRPRRQDFSGYVLENGACYINKAGNILRDGNRLSGKVSFFELPEYTAYEIDEEDDFLIIERLMERYKEAIK